MGTPMVCTIAPYPRKVGSPVPFSQSPSREKGFPTYKYPAHSHAYINGSGWIATL
ncbi:MAG: hypothetical protein N2110_09315 [Flavobacteriales bacterium]|nr:hypothetical protein [Flavobacteriales bacterium]